MPRRAMQWVVLGLWCAAAWAGLAGWAAAATKASFGNPTTPPNLIHIPPFVAKDQGFFAEEGLDVEITTFEGGVYAIRNVVSGAMDVGWGAGGSAAVSIARKAGIKVIYGVAPRFGSTMTVRSTLIKGLQDLKGKNLGVQEVGGFADILTRMVLRKANIKPDEVTFVPIASADVPPLLAGQIDTAVLHVDQLMLARQKDASFHSLVNFWELEPNQLFLVVVAPEKKLAAEPAKAGREVIGVQPMLETERKYKAHQSRPICSHIFHAQCTRIRTVFRRNTRFSYHESCQFLRYCLSC